MERNMEDLLMEDDLQWLSGSHVFIMFNQSLYSWETDWVFSTFMNDDRMNVIKKHTKASVCLTDYQL